MPSPSKPFYDEYFNPYRNLHRPCAQPDLVVDQKGRTRRIYRRYKTPLEILLHHLGARSVILTGLATNSCIVCTAHDAKMRHFNLYVPSDCSAARTRREHEQAIEHIKEMTGASVVASSSLRVSELRGESRSKPSKA